MGRLWRDIRGWLTWWWLTAWWTVRTVLRPKQTITLRYPMGVVFFWPGDKITDGGGVFRVVRVKRNSLGQLIVVVEAGSEARHDQA